jgi:hypothetical protein
MSDPLSQYYRCPERYLRFESKPGAANVSGYFRFGQDAICYGSYAGRALPSTPSAPLHDALLDTTVENGTVHLPFDWKQAVDNLRYEVYARDYWHGDSAIRSAVTSTYYFVRPILPIAVRKHLQKIRLNGWHHSEFPRWPVDRTVEHLFEQLLLLTLRSQRLAHIPFIWFWPDGASSCAIITHDVETASGRDHCASLMDVDDRFGIRTSFQIVPERRYDVPARFLDSIRSRGNEINIQDLNHDGHLFRNRQEFDVRAVKINAYARQYRAAGFRAAILYRRQDWMDALNFKYDMSVPNVAHLDPQRGGCCTVMPYFNGNMLELPVTTTQDYSLFHILNDYSLDLWKRQIALIMEKHGLIHFVIHPDYIMGARERRIYEALLAHLMQLRSQKSVWMPTAGEVNHWWRQRAEMTLVEDGDRWRIEGAGKERAHVAYANERDGRLVLTLPSKLKAVDASS